MKRILITLIVLMCSNLLFGQIAYHKSKAKKEFENMNYTAAIKHYEQLEASFSADLADLKNLAESYLKVNDTKDAERILRKIVVQDVNEPYYVKKLAMVQTSNAKYLEALANWEKYAALAPADVVANHSVEALQKMPKLQRDSLFIDIYDLNINSHWTEFSPHIVNNQLVFVSNRAVGPVHHVFEWNHTPFLDIYAVDTAKILKKKYRKPLGVEGEVDENHQSYSKKIAGLHDDHTPMTSNDNNTGGYFGHHPPVDSMWAKDSIYGDVVTKFNAHLHSTYHEGSVAFTSDYKKMYFTANDPRSKKEDGVIKLKIVEANLNSKGKYKDAQKLPFNSIHYAVCHPTILKDDRTMIFSSDMPGGLGGMDLYKSTQSNDGNWSTPVNLGPNINTNLNEIFPFVDTLGVLYFASEGWGGFGGLDILKKNLNDDAIPINLGYPINSNKDDFGLFKSNKQKGYFSSNRKHGGSDDDLYFFIDKRRDTKKLVVITKVKKLDGSIVALDAVDIAVVDAATKEVVKRDTSKGSLTTVIELPTRHQYNVAAKHHDMATLTAMVDFESDMVNDDTLELVFIQEEDQLLVNGVVKDGATGKSLANAKVFVYDVTNQTSAVYVSDANGKYAYNAKYNSKYLVKGMHEGYFADCQQVVVKNKKDSANTDPLILSKIQVNKTFEIKDLYYDYKKWDIRADAAMVLDRLVHFLAEYPEIHVELGSHTDARGGDKYNHDLSQSRAASAVNYVVQHGIEASRIRAKGYGETKLLNRCKNNVKCSEEAHQLNRRTEVKVTEVEKDPVAIAKATAISEANVFTNLSDFDPCKTVTIGE